MDELEKAIELLTSDSAAKEINNKIEYHQSQLNKLRPLMKIVGKPTVKQTNVIANHLDIEEAICNAVKRMPLLPKEISEKIDIPYMDIGKVVAASSKLKKIGKRISLAEFSFKD